MNKFKPITLLFILILFLSFVGAIDAPEVESSTHPDEDKWFNKTAPSFRWEEVEGATGYSFVLDMAEDTDPTEACEDVTSTEYPSKKDGIFYFHIQTCKGSQRSETAHYTVKIDKSGPTVPIRPKATPLSEGGLELTWEVAEDKLSGVAGYDIFRSYLGGFDVRTEAAYIASYEDVPTNLYRDVNDMAEGITYHYKVRPVDNAGNPGKISLEFRGTTLTFCDLTISIDITKEDSNLLIDVDAEGEDMIAASLKIMPVDRNSIILAQDNRTTTLSGSYDLGQSIDGNLLISVKSKDNDGDMCDLNKIFVLDSVLPDANWLNPKSNSKIGSITRLTVEAVDSGVNPSGIASVELLYKMEEDWANIATLSEGIDNMYSYDWNTLGVANGRATLKAIVKDFVENSVEKEIMVTIENLITLKNEADSAIKAAKDKKQEAVEKRTDLAEKNISLEGFDQIVEQADNNVGEARSLFRTGRQYESAKRVAEYGAQLYEEAIGLISYREYKSDDYSYSRRKIKSKLQEEGLAPNLIDEAEELIASLDAKRTLQILKVSPKGEADYYQANIVISLKNNTSSAIEVQAVEVIPKGFILNAADIASGRDFNVFEEDPILGVYFDSLAVGEEAEFIYGFKEHLSKADSDELISDKIINEFNSPPVVLNKSTYVGRDSFQRPFDIMALIAPLLSFVEGLGIGAGTLLAIGGILIVVILIVMIIVLIIAIVVILIRRRKQSPLYYK